MRLQVFVAVRQAGRITRIDIAHRTPVSPATVTAITSELLAAGLIEEVVPEEDAGSAKCGRPRVSLKIRGDAYLIAGIKFADRQVSVILIDFVGDPIGEYTKQLPAHPMSPDGMGDLVEAALRAACARPARTRDVTSKRLQALALALPDWSMPAGISSIGRHRWISAMWNYGRS